MRTVIAAALCLLLVPSALARDGLVAKPSKYPVKETMDKLAAALEAKGIKPAARINHAAAAEANGLSLKPTEVMLFGNPKVGTPLMQANRRAAIDLPMRVLAWEDDKGKTFIAYVPPKTLKSRYRLKGRDAELKAMGDALEAFTKAAAE